jgi:hypothetical protein
MAPTLVFALSFAASVLCAGLLIRASLRTRRRFLLWCALCFLLFAVNHALALLDILWLPDGTLVVYRQAASLGAVLVLIYGFMWEVD